jgi:stalled ribosome rescue protein Dom34
MNTSVYSVVWLDHLQAKIYQVNSPATDPLYIHTNQSGQHLQHKANVPGSGHKGVDVEFFKRIASALEKSDSVLITGPGTAKNEFNNYLDKTHPALSGRVRGVETLDHPSETFLLSLARSFLKTHDPAFQLATTKH